MKFGDALVRREVWRGRPWFGLSVRVIEDSADLLAFHVPRGAPFGFVDGHPLGRHFWRDNTSWQGPGIVMAQRPGDAYSIWFFGDWTYVNLQDPFRLTSTCVDTFDHELDIVVASDGTWTFKDDDKLETCVEIGRFDRDEITRIRAEGARLGAMLDAGSTWWTELEPSFRSWDAPASWSIPELPNDWANTDLVNTDRREHRPA